MQRMSFEESWNFLRENTYLLYYNDVFPDKLTPAGYYKPEGWLDIYKCSDLSANGEDDEPESGEIWKLEDLTMPCVFLCRCGVYHTSFRNTSLVDSSFCWNDFINVDFTDADLSWCDLRCSHFENVSFVRANLTDADLRSSDFTNCDFSGAQMQGVKLTRPQAKELVLSEEQRASIAWKRSIGREPKGG